MKRITDNLPEILFIIGLLFIIIATFLINFIAGIYSLGLILTGLGVLLARKPIEKKKKGGEN